MTNISAALFPGLLAGSWMWEHQIPVLQDLGLACSAMTDAFVVQDLADNTVAGLFAACCSFIDQIPVPTFIIGNSLGALLALQVAAARPDKVLGVIASGAPGLGDESDLGIGMRRVLSGDYAVSIKKRILYDPSKVTDDFAVTEMSKLASPRNLLRCIKLLRDVRTVDVLPLLRQTTCPTTLIWGAQDIICPPTPWKSATQGLELMEFHEIDRCGHSPMLETPAEFNQLMRNFIVRQLESQSAQAMLDV